MKNSVSQHNNSQTEKAIVKTLLYSDLFNFPLSKEELWNYLISGKKIKRTDFEQTLDFLRKKNNIVYKNDLYCLDGRENIIKERKRNHAEVVKKVTLAKKVASSLSYIPTIYCIGISGGLSVGSAGKTDDIDFFIITQKNTLFVTRLWILALLEMMNLRRRRNEKHPANKICVNLLIEETALQWPSPKRNLYTAREIVQMKPLFERHDTYAKFLQTNTWVKKFCPNALENVSLIEKKWQRNYISLAITSFFLSSLPVELCIRTVQKIIMQKHRTKEIINDNFLALHPIDYGSQIMQLLQKKSQLLGLLTKE